jgi:hypothetical protein
MMQQKTLITCFIFTLMYCSSLAQIKALTDNGDEVLLNSDGTWKYINDSNYNANKIDTNKIDFLKSKEATFLVKSTKTNCGIYINPKKWFFEKSKATDASEYEFTLKNEDVYAMIVAEKIEMPIESLRLVALENAKEAAPDIKIINQEYRNVNGNIVLQMQMAGTISGVKFTFLGHYYSFPNGTIQFLTYTATSLFIEHKKELEDFLNGFVVLNQK